VYDSFAMANHDNSESARACVREYVEQNAQLIISWLEGSGAVEDVSAELILSVSEKGSQRLIRDILDHSSMHTITFMQIDNLANHYPCTWRIGGISTCLAHLQTSMSQK